MKTNPIYEALIFPAAEQDLLDIKEYWRFRLYGGKPQNMLELTHE